MTANLLILVVEDEYLSLSVLETALQEGGFEVISAASAEEAMEILESRNADLRALLTDINLSGELTGWDVAKRGRELNAALPIVYMTGASAQEWSVSGVPNSVLLTKPFALAQAVTAVAQLLNDVSTLPPVSG